MNAHNDHRAYDWRAFVTAENFELSPLEESIINIFWENMRDEAPSKANIKLNLTKIATGYQADWSINNFDLSFVAQGEDSELRLLLQNLQRQLSSQLAEWKKSRFSTQSATF